MSFTVGLDFGTHQTKVCIENASNPAQKLYEFVEFKNSNGKTSILFPSIVQINNDNTISYGFVDMAKCKNVDSKIIEPKLELLPKPKLDLPNRPLKSKYPEKSIKEKIDNLTWKEQLLKFKKSNFKSIKTSAQNVKEECNKIENKYNEAVRIWEEEIISIKRKHSRKVEIWRNKNDELRKEYNKKIREWENKKFHFRYFKLASFYNSNSWNLEINSDIISVWYIAYILFLLQEKLGDDFFVQMGIPSGLDETILKQQEGKAYNILVAAYKLVDLYKTKEVYLAEEFTNLLEVTELNEYSEDDILYYGLKVLPEAYAGLTSVTQQERLELGMNLLVDIGGGTTDIAFFTIPNNQPDIHAVISFPKGLNFIFEQHNIQNRDLTIDELQKKFFETLGKQSLFTTSIDKYKHELKCEVEKMEMRIIKSFEQRYHIHKLETSKLRNALRNRPVVFCGGGAIYESMHTSVLNFSDIKLIDKNLLNIPYIVNQDIDEELFTLLATSYGLSIPLENDVKLTPIDQIFNHIITPDSNEKNYRYEHGLSDY